MDNFLELTADYFSDGFSIIDDEPNYGAWRQMHIDIATHLLTECKTSIGVTPPDEIDVDDIVGYYMEHRQ